ncbi:hypothetical protein scyTo_0013532 [Scyliorhinus torazame]|uniref:Uncharacterized protein n=1 Tax=Scyliorhinus torazame TaxID=75743 RepID=A0A401NYT3_SCYTO|nr:hypothetical protein [Scyliorhinus torazame]
MFAALLGVQFSPGSVVVQRVGHCLHLPLAGVEAHPLHQLVEALHHVGPLQRAERDDLRRLPDGVPAGELLHQLPAELGQPARGPRGQAAADRLHDPVLAQLADEDVDGAGVLGAQQAPDEAQELRRRQLHLVEEEDRDPLGPAGFGKGGRDPGGQSGVLAGMSCQLLVPHGVLEDDPRPQLEPEVLADQSPQVALANTSGSIDGQEQGLLMNVGGKVIPQQFGELIQCQRLTEKLPVQGLLQLINVIEQEVVVQILVGVVDLEPHDQTK